VVLVKSFARIHETNLKKQGILPLTFKDPRDYDRFGAQDRVSVTGLAKLAPGKPVTVTIRKPDGRTETIEALHSLTDEHIAWFKAGSALNAAQGERPRSEEHTSELQSLAYLVCRLLLEKKKKKLNRSILIIE